jgi:hypothetical protein
MRNLPIVVKIPKEQVFEIVRHFLFGLPQKQDHDVIFSTWHVKDELYGIEIENRDLFKARQWILGCARNFEELEEFRIFWEEHLERLEKWRKNVEAAK